MADAASDQLNNLIELERDLNFLKAFLSETVQKRRMYEMKPYMVKEIQDFVYEVEDIIEAFVSNAALEKRPFSKRTKNPADLHRVCTRAEDNRRKAERLVADFRNRFVDNEDNRGKLECRRPRKKKVVGFADVTEDLVRRLTQETDYFDVISVIGMFGMGKTTLAWKVFNDPQIYYNFPTRIWLSISQDFSATDMFLDILKEFNTINDVIRSKSNLELADMVAAHLESGSFLIVMDDVWSSVEWDRLFEVLPHHNTKGKVLITSRIEYVGKRTNKMIPPYNLRFFTAEESWELLRLEALGKLDCPSGLEVVGREIARNCFGLPLAIVVIGGILATKYSGSKIKDWERVSKHVSSYLREMDLADRMRKSIYLSYDDLPYDLRPCFLYFGMFPKDCEIPVSKLIRMWIGEGFVQQNVGRSLEETAEMYLNDLISRNLVIVGKFKPDGRLKTCRVHDTLRNFCLTEAANAHFLQEIKCQSNGQFTPSTYEMDTYRRLSLHSDCLDFISLRPSGPGVRSFVCFSDDNYIVSPENSTNIIRAFKLLRVLDVSPFKLTKIDNDIYNLLHLRYVALSAVLSVLPSKLNQLWNIQTLIVDTTCHTLQVEADIWKMNQLRHFKTNASATLLKPGKSGKGGAELQTLGLISVESCTEELFDRVPNLKKLGIRGQLALLMNGKKGSLDGLWRMSNLEKLKLINDAYPNPRSEGGLGFLPGHYIFPPSLTSLTLCATFLSWEHMSTLGLLERLEVLKLKDNAFSGSVLNAVDGGFQRLEVLHVEDTDLIVWNASSRHYPNLRGLVLKYCEKLRGIPAELADIRSLQKLELHTCISAAKSAQDISDAKRKTLARGSAFVLSIFPPIK